MRGLRLPRSCTQAPAWVCRESRALPASKQSAGPQQSTEWGAQHSSAPRAEHTSISRHRLQGRNKEDPRYTAFIPWHYQPSQPPALQHCRVQLCCEDSTRFPSPGHSKENWKCLRRASCSSYPVCNASCCKCRWEKTASPALQQTGIFVPE